MDHTALQAMRLAGVAAVFDRNPKTVARGFRKLVDG
jgi:hypothetical protein